MAEKQPMTTTPNADAGRTYSDRELETITTWDGGHLKTPPEWYRCEIWYRENGERKKILTDSATPQDAVIKAVKEYTDLFRAERDAARAALAHMEADLYELCDLLDNQGIKSDICDKLPDKRLAAEPEGREGE